MSKSTHLINNGHLHMRISTSLLIPLMGGCLAFLQIGCVRERSLFDHELALTSRVMTPAPSGSAKALVQPDADLKRWADEYYNLDGYFEASALRSRQEDRNNIIRRLVLLDDEYFLAWSTHLYGGQSAVTTGGEILNTALTGAAAILNPGSATTVLSAVASGLSAARTSVDKNFFFQQNIPTLVSKMEQLRAEVKTQLREYYNKPVTDYTLDDGLQDFIRYYKAGTLTAAAEALNLQVNQGRQAAQDQLETAKGDQRVAAPRLKANAAAAVVEAQSKQDSAIIPPPDYPLTPHYHSTSVIPRLQRRSQSTGSAGTAFSRRRTQLTQSIGAAKDAAVIYQRASRIPELKLASIPPIQTPAEYLIQTVLTWKAEDANKLTILEGIVAEVQLQQKQAPRSGTRAAAAAYHDRVQKLLTVLDDPNLSEKTAQDAFNRISDTLYLLEPPSSTTHKEALKQFLNQRQDNASSPNEQAVRTFEEVFRGLNLQH